MANHDSEYRLMWKNYLRDQTPVVEKTKDYKVEHMTGDVKLATA